MRVKRLWRASGLILAAAAVVSAGGCQSGTKSAAPTASVAPERAVLDERQRELNLQTFDIVWTTVRDRHYDPTLGGVDWPAVRDRLRPKMEQAQTQAQARAVLTEMLLTLGQSHMAILPSEAYLAEATARSEARSAPARPSTPSQPTSTASASTPASTPSAAAESSDRGSVGLDLRVVDGRALVTRVLPGSPAEGAGVQTGWELVSVGRYDVRRGLARLAAAPTNRNVPIEALQAFTLRALMSAAPGEKVHLGFLDGRDRAVVRTMTAGEPAGFPVKFGQLPTEFLEIDARRIPSSGPVTSAAPQSGGIAYFFFNIWLDPVRVNGVFEGLLREAGAAEGLIIDLRGNPGGLGAMAMGLGGYLVNERNLVLGETRLRNGNQRYVLNPRTPNFAGPVAVLVDELSASTSEIFAGGLKDIGRARLFGTRTAGAALPSVIEILPNGDRFQYVFANYTSASGEALEGNGVTPHEVVPLDRASLLAGRDPVLDAARAWIRSQGSRLSVLP